MPASSGRWIPVTGATTLVGATGHAITGIVARGNQLYGAGGRGDNTFYRIDTTTGAATEIGSFGYGGWINSVSMGFDDSGTLLGGPQLRAAGAGLDNGSRLERSGHARSELPARCTIVGPITGPESLSQVGMKGFAIGPPRCIARQSVPRRGAGRYAAVASRSPG